MVRSPIATGQVQPAVNQHLLVLFHQAMSQPLISQPAWGCCDPIGFSTWPCCPSYNWLWPMDPAYPYPSAEHSYPPQINISTQVSAICKLTEDALHPLFQIIDKNIHPNTESWKTPLMTSWIYFHSPQLPGPGHPARFLTRKEYICPSHECPGSPGKCSGKRCQKLKSG